MGTENVIFLNLIKKDEILDIYYYSFTLSFL